MLLIITKSSQILQKVVRYYKKVARYYKKLSDITKSCQIPLNVVNITKLNRNNIQPEVFKQKIYNPCNKYLIKYLTIIRVKKSPPVQFHQKIKIYQD